VRLKKHRIVRWKWLLLWVGTKDKAYVLEQFATREIGRANKRERVVKQVNPSSQALARRTLQLVKAKVSTEFFAKRYCD
jgi:hypothetical protein